ncbi:SRPBCC family protein [Nocardia nova]|uniref:SRPBCC family protein n=1 Tax=Nocardia nova TaxID=37330 RepID=UPI0033C3EF6A
MVDVRMRVPGSIDRVFAVLADGWSYGHWVVGSTHMRDVDEGWPAVGTRIHHSVGAWPITTEQATTVIAVDPPNSLELEAQLWPLGVAWIRMGLEAVDAETTEVTMGERALRGPACLIPGPIQALGLIPRNRQSLHRLCDLVAAHYADPAS